MSFKQKLEDNPLWFGLSIAVVTFGMGWAASQAISQASHTSGSQDWTDQAKSAGWAPKKECPAYPLNIQVTAPGDGASVEFTTGGGSQMLRTAIVIQSERPIPVSNHVGYIWNPKGDNNYYVAFPPRTYESPQKVFRDNDYVSLPFSLSVPGYLNLWAVVTDDSEKLEGTYTSLDQIKKSDPDAMISAPIMLSVRPAAQ